MRAPSCNLPTLALTLAAMIITSPTVAARSLMECDQRVRVGSRLIMAGDDAHRSRAVLERHPQWTLQRGGRKSMVWRRDGRNPATLRLAISNGRLSRVCQHLG
ncbi:MAG: hypothetical protein ABF296_01965 [Oceanococcaceae bacterium]